MLFEQHILNEWLSLKQSKLKIQKTKPIIKKKGNTPKDSKLRQHSHGGVDLEYNNNRLCDIVKSKILDARSYIGRRWHVVPMTWLLVSSKHTNTINQLFMIKCLCIHNIVYVTKYPYDCNIKTLVPTQGWNYKHVNYTTRKHQQSKGLLWHYKENA
jgi:hypothetical protein